MKENNNINNNIKMKIIERENRKYQWKKCNNNHRKWK